MKKEYAIELMRAQLDGSPKWPSPSGEEEWRVVDVGYVLLSVAVDAAREMLEDAAGVRARVYAYDAAAPESVAYAPEPVWEDGAVLVDEDGDARHAPYRRVVEAHAAPRWVDPYADRPNGRFGVHMLMELTDHNRRPRGVDWNPYGGREVPTHHPLENVARVYALHDDDAAHGLQHAPNAATH